MKYLLYLSAYNILVLIIFGLDKLFAKLHSRRIPEKVLLSLTIAFGSAGAIAGMVLFHHKISKPAFRYPVAILFILHAALFALYLHGIV